MNGDATHGPGRASPAAMLFAGPRHWTPRHPIRLAILALTVLFSACTRLIAPASQAPQATTAATDASVSSTDLVRAFDAERALAHIRDLAAERYAGRRAGTPGGDAAAEYVAAEFERLGLAPAGDEDTYFQRFPMAFLDLAMTPELALLGGSGTPQIQYSHLEDFRELVIGPAGPGAATAAVVYAAAGDPPDYAKLAPDGKIVLVDAALRGGDILPAVEAAVGRGAAGVLIVAADDTRIHMRGSYIAPLADTTRPVLYISRRVAADIARAAGVTLAESAQALDVTMRMEVALQPTAQVTSSNVLGLWPGSDPARQGQTILVGGHYDHLGRLPSGEYFPGANDNASGVAIMLALAETWRSTGFRPGPSVLFVAWGAEEVGLAGSQYYTRFPRAGLGDTLAYLDLDAAGQGDGDGLAVEYGDQGLALQVAGAARDLGYDLPVAAGGGSDHDALNAAGVPSVLIIARGAIDTLHTQTDTPQAIEVDNLRQAGEITWLMVLRLGGR